MTLKEVATKVIDNNELKTVVMNYVLFGMLNLEEYETLIPYENLVGFQVLECERPIEEAGYQLGEPWAGNIKSAPILFVNKTLNYVADEYCPRYIPNDCPDGFEIAYTDRIFKERLMEGNMTVDQVITFCNTRLKKAAIKGNGLYTKVREGIKPIRYWGAIRNNVELLLPDDFKALLKKKFADTIETGEYTREIMKLVACTSAVPFKVVPSIALKYKKWFEEDKTFEHCWHTFAEDVISLSGAKIIVLVGKEVLDAFEGSARFSEKELVISEKTRTGNIVNLYKLDNRLITSVDVAQGGMKRLDKYFGENSSILETLRARVNDLVNASRRQLKKELG